MKLFGLYILTDKSLKEELSKAKSEQRQVDMVMMKKLTHANSILAYNIHQLKAIIQKSGIKTNEPRSSKSLKG